MEFIQRESLRDGEEALYVPKTHGFFTARHMAFSLPFFLGLVFLWLTAESRVASFAWLAGSADAAAMRFSIKGVFLSAVIVVLLVFIWRVFRYLNTEYCVTDKRLIVKKGVVRIATSEITLGRVGNIRCLQGPLGRIFNYGTVRVSGVGGGTLAFRMVRDPYGFRRAIIEAVENAPDAIALGERRSAKPAGANGGKATDDIRRYGVFLKTLPDADKKGKNAKSQTAQNNIPEQRRQKPNEAKNNGYKAQKA